MLFCSVYACEIGKCEETRGPARSSPAVVAEVKLLTKEVTVYEGGVYEHIQVQSSIPPRLLCATPDRDTACRLSVHTKLEGAKKEKKCPGSSEEIVQAVFGVDKEAEEVRPCEYVVLMRRWSQVMQIPVKGAVDGLKDRDQKRFVSVSVSVFIDELVDTTIAVGQVKLTVKDRNSKHGRCRSTGDPHVRTFDGRYFDVYLEGEFIQYRHLHLPYEIHTYQRECRKAACLCSVSVKSGNDIIVFDQCGSKQVDKSASRPIQVSAYFNGELTPGTRVYSKHSGSEYTVILPTGSVLQVKQVKMFGERYLNMYFQASASDFGNTEGLCGTFDNDKSNDLLTATGQIYGGNSKRPDEFSHSWRASETHYMGLCDEGKELPELRELDCACMEDSAVCSPDMAIQSCPVAWKRRGKNYRSYGEEITATLITQSLKIDICSPSRDIIVWEFRLEFIGAVFTWPTKSGITRGMAKQRCLSYLEQHPALSPCVDLLGEDFQLALEGCVMDIQISDSYDFVLSFFYEIVQTCTSVIEFDVELWITVDTTGVVTLPTLTRDLCTEECRPHGHCQDGACVCDDGWLGEACDIEASLPPDIFSLDNSLCDIAERDCDSVTVYGSRFVKTEKLVCRFESQEGEEHIEPAEFRSPEVVDCKLPVFDVMMISLSNDGVTYSKKALQYRRFNSLCVLCEEETGVCSPQKNICNIDGECYIDGAFNPSHPDESCSPTISTVSWTPTRVDRIAEYRFSWVTLIEEVLVTSVGNISISGDVKLSLNSRKRTVIELSGEDQFLDLTDTKAIAESCLFTPSQCRHGFILMLTLNLHALEHDTYILTNGGDLDDGMGIAMYTKKDRLFITVSTETKLWEVYIRTKEISLNQYHDYEISWTQQHGLACSFDGKEMKKSTKPKKRKKKDRHVNKFFFGRSIKLTNRRALECELEQWQVLFAATEVAVSLGIPVGYPKLAKPPSIITEVKESGEIQFRCQFAAVKGLNVQYGLEYYLDNKELLSETLDSLDNISALTQEHMPGVQLGSQLSCNVWVCLVDECEATQGEVSQSSIVTLGIQLQTKSVTVTEGEVGHIVIQLTVPPSFFCPPSEKDSCSVTLNAGIRAAKEKKCPDKSIIQQAVISWEGEGQPFCGVIVRPDSWASEHTIMVKGVMDSVKDKKQKRTVNVWASISSASVHRQFDVGKVQLTVEDSDERRAVCSSVNDPHITTFDGRKYNNFYEGEFEFINIIGSGIKIHTYYRSCNKRASCNCAVAVKVDDDVLVLDKCGPSRGLEGKSFPLSLKLYQNKQLTPGFSVYKRKGGDYTVYLPNGFMLKVRTQKRRGSANFINVYLTASAAGFNKTEGLCGTYDDNKDNDLMKRDGALYTGTEKEPREFSATWRVGPEDSLYDGYCGEAERHLNPLYCICEYGQPSVCGTGYDVFSCNKQRKKTDKKKGKDITEELMKEAVAPRKCYSDEPRILFQFNITYVHEYIDFGISKIEALDYCRSQVQLSQSVASCKSVISTNFEVAIDFCVEDLLITGNFSWMEVSRENIKELCALEVSADLDLWVEVDGEVALPMFVGTICPNECSEKGTCVDGTCICEEGYVGDDCSVSLTEAPVIVSLGGGILCDTFLAPCTSITVYGFGFAETDTLTCHFHKLIKGEAEWSVSGASETRVAEYVTEEEVRCELPAADSYQIRLSIDGATVSNTLQIIVYNSICERCTVTGCTEKTDICKIDNVCYKDGFINPLNAKQICKVGIEGWTAITRTDIKVEILSFMKIIGNVLKTSLFDIKLLGTKLPVLVESQSGGKAVKLDGVDQLLDLGDHTGECVVDLEKCSNGLTISFQLKLLSFTGSVEGDRLTIFSSGADVEGRYGTAMWYSKKLKQLCVRVSTSDKEWTVCTPQVRLQEYFDCKFSWSIQTGLKLLVNGVIVGTQKIFIQRTVRGAVQNKFYIGASVSMKAFANIEMVGWNVAYATDKVVDALEVVTELPVFAVAPELSVEVDEACVNNTMSLQCKFSPLIPKPLQYQVQWFVDDVAIKTDNLGTNTVSVLSEFELGTILLNSKLECGVSACYEDDCENTRGPQKKSKVFSPSVKVSKSELTLTEGSVSEHVHVSLPLPPRVFCTEDDKSICTVRIHTYIKNKHRPLKCGDGRSIPQALVGWTGKGSEEAFCGATLTATNWCSGISIPVRATLDGLKDGRQERQLILQASLMLGATISLTVPASSVQLMVQDRDQTAVCSAVGDPHIFTFDGRKYNVYLEGEFLLYKHRTLPIKVSTVFRPCNKNKGASCVCTVAVAVADDVIVIDKCGSARTDPSKQQPVTIRAYVNGELAPGTRVLQYNNGKKIRVLLMSGGYVTIKKSRYLAGTYLDVWVRASSADFQQTQGLCGFFDEDRSNDLTLPNGKIYTGREERPNDFSNMWRLRESESLTKGICAAVSVPTDSTGVFCSCLEEEQGADSCGQDITFTSCLRDYTSGKKNKKWKDITADVLTSDIFQSPPERCLGTPLEIWEFDISYVGGVFVWPTPSNITRVVAVEECRTRIKGGASGQACEAVVSTTFTTSLETCIDDVQIMDSLEWASSALGHLLEVCETRVQFDMTLWEATVVDGVEVMLPPTKLTDVLCPQDCSGNGQCLQGECVCNGDFGGDDCSISLVESPTVFEQPNPFCDTRLEDCLTFTVLGEGFADEDTLKCEVQRLQKTESGFSVQGDKFVVAATYISAEEVRCKFQRAGFYQVQVYVTEASISQPVRFLGFDSVCETCSGDSCQPRTDICKIDDECYADGFLNLLDPTQRCVQGSDTWLTIAVTDILVEEYLFMKIVGEKLVTSLYELTVYGAPKLVELPSGGTALQLDGASQYVDLSTAPRNCLWNPLECVLGFTVGFRLKITESREMITIFSNGGEESNGYGVAMYIREGRFYCTVSTATQVWTVLTTEFTINIFISVEYTWSLQNGLALYFDGVMVAETKTYITRVQVETIYNSFFIGKSVSQEVFAPCVIEGWTVKNATKAAADAVLPARPTSVTPTSSSTLMQTSTTGELDSSTQLETSASTTEQVSSTPTSTTEQVSSTPKSTTEQVSSLLTISTEQISNTATSTTEKYSSTPTSSTEHKSSTPTRTSEQVLSTPTSTTEQVSSTSQSTLVSSSQSITTVVDISSTSVIRNTAVESSMTPTLTASESTSSPTLESSAVSTSELTSTMSQVSLIPSLTSGVSETLSDIMVTPSATVVSIMPSSTVSEPLTTVLTELPTTFTTELPTTVTTEPSCLGEVDSFPAMTQTPTLSYIIVESHVMFACSMEQLPETGVQYTVTWLLGIEQLNVETLIDTNVARLDSSTLTTEQRAAILTDGLTCRSYAFNPARCGSGQSDELTSDDIYKFQFKVESSSSLVVLEEGSHLDVTVSLGLSPDLYCLLHYTTMCTVYAEAKIVALEPSVANRCTDDRTIDPLVVRYTDSGTEPICGTGMATATGVISLYSVVDRLHMTSNQTVTVKFYQRDMVGETQQQNVEREQLVVTVVNTDQENTLCSCTGDPHFRSFDQLTYDLMLAGEFVLYKHTEMASEVRVYAEATGKGSTLCGVTVRSGNDVVRFSKCHLKLTSEQEEIRVDPLFHGTLTPGTRVIMQADGQIYRVLLPCGTLVTVKNADLFYINVYLEPSALVRGKSRGMCGILDGDTSNDLTHSDSAQTTYVQDEEPLDFGRSWRFAPNSENSMFNGYQGNEDTSLVTYCSCNDGKDPMCDSSRNVDQCGLILLPNLAKDITQQLLDIYLEDIQQQSITRRKRQLLGGFQYDPDFQASQTAVWPTTSGITKEQATSICGTKIRSSLAYDKCKDFDKTQYTTDISNCVKDIQLTDNIRWAERTLEDVKQRCLSAVSRNTATWNQTGATLSLPAAIIQNLCLGDCNNRNGTCSQKGECVCNSEFRGVDCSQRIGSAPVLSTVESNRLCKIQGENCNTTTIYGRNLMKDRVTCHLQPVTVNSQGGVSQEGSKVLRKAVYLSSAMVRCELPERRSYLIQISNQDSGPSEDSALYIAYNPTCLQCAVSNTESTGTCRNQLTGCIVGQQCYPSGYRKDICTICDPAKSMKTWTRLTGDNCLDVTTTLPTTEGFPTEDGATSSSVVIGISAGIAGVFLIAIIITAYVIYIRSRGNKPQLLNELDRESGHYYRTYDGNYGLRTDKQLSFYNTTTRDF